MRKMTALLVLSALFLSSIFIEGVDASSSTEQLIQDYHFSSSDNYAYWGIYRGSYPTTNSAGKPVNPAFNIILDNSKQLADIYSTESGPSNEAWGYDEWAYVYQQVHVPSVNIVNATLSLYVYGHMGEYMDVDLQYGIASKASRSYWIQHSSVGLGYGQYRTYTLNVTGTLQQYEGKNITIMAGIYMPSSSILQSGYTYIYWIKLDIQYNGESNGGSGGSSGSGWSSGGSSWWGGGGSWWGSGGSWHGGGSWYGGGGSWTGGGAVANETYLEYVANNIEELIGIVAGITISILWVKVAVNLFSDDPEKKQKGREDAFRAFVATLIIAVAVLGALWMVAGWIVGVS